MNRIKYAPPEATLKAIDAGARLMVVKMDLMPKELEKILKGFHLSNLPFNKGDKIFIAEEFLVAYICGEKLTWYKADWDIKGAMLHPDRKWQPASEMTEEQSRFKFTIGEINVKKVQDIVDPNECLLIAPKLDNYSQFINWLEAQGINYEANEYIALVQLEKE